MTPKKWFIAAGYIGGIIIALIGVNMDEHRSFIGRGFFVMLFGLLIFLTAGIVRLRMIRRGEY